MLKFLKKILFGEKENIKIYNEDFIEKEKEKYKSLFDNIEGKSLDEQQRTAIVTDSEANLVIAGAGSGKTLTIVGKVKYLLEKGIQPKEILLLSYSNKTVDELNAKIKNKTEEKIAYTFHAFGNKILGKKLLKETKEYINKNTLVKLLREDEDFNRNYLEYLFCYSHDMITELDFENKNEMYNATPSNLISYNEYIKSKVRTIIYNLKILYYKNHKTLDGFNKETALLELEKDQASTNIRNFLETFHENLYKIAEEEKEEKNIKKELEEEKEEKNIKEELKEMKEKEFTDEEKLLRKYCSTKKTVQLDNRKKVRSEEERIISNFLVLEGINFEYEILYKNGNFKTPDQKDFFYDENKGKDSEFKKYTPDFYLTDYDIYLEHFGVSKDMKPHQYDEEKNKKYVESMEWKRQVHQLNGTKLLETYSYYSQENIFIEKLKEILVKNGVELKPLSKEKIRLLTILIEDHYENDAFVNLVLTFLQLFKSNGYKEDKILEFEKEAEKKPEYLKKKHQLFFSLFRKIFSYYNEQKDKDKNTVDFNDMINEATERIEKTSILQDLGHNYKYIIIDEFQDTSYSRFKLVKAIIKKTKAHLMAVGDDWQSMYRFAGSDISIFTNLKDHFSKMTECKIENTYRNSQQLIDLASRFIKSNKEQIEKQLSSVKSLDKPIKILCCKKEELGIKVTDILKKIEENLKNNFYKKEKIEVMILVRNNKEFNSLNGNLFFSMENSSLIKEILKEKGYEDISNISCGTLERLIKSLKEKYDKNQKKNRNENVEEDNRTILAPWLNKNIAISFQTIHKSKGLEADEVIVLGNNDEIYGFPTKVQDDSILEYLLPKKEKFLFAEERRLFYVALTRTKNHTYLIIDEDKPSSFIEELIHLDEGIGTLGYESEYETFKNLKCHVCQGPLVERINSEIKQKFLGCGNYPSCGYTEAQKENRIKKDDLKIEVDSPGKRINIVYSIVEGLLKKYRNLNSEDKQKFIQSFFVEVGAVFTAIMIGNEVVGSLLITASHKIGENVRKEIELNQKEKEEIEKIFNNSKEIEEKYC